MNKIEELKKSGDLLDIDKLKLYLKILQLKEIDTYLHSVRVSRYSTLLAKKLDFSDELVAITWLSALLHDLGKIFIPNYVLLGTDKLSEYEYELIKKHPQDGLMYLDEFVSKRVSKGAIEHHERLDGKGYPYGVKDISTIGRIIAITDTFDAMTSNRTYQNAISFEDAIYRMESLVECNLYDKSIFLKFKEIIIFEN